MIMRNRFIMLSVTVFSLATPAAIVVAQDSSEPGR